MMPYVILWLDEVVDAILIVSLLNATKGGRYTTLTASSTKVTSRWNACGKVMVVRFHRRTNNCAHTAIHPIAAVFCVFPHVAVHHRSL